MTSSSNTSSGGIGFVSGLTILFVALKLLHIINWSWWWVLSPLWITTLVVVIGIGIIFLLMAKGKVKL